MSPEKRLGDFLDGHPVLARRDLALELAQPLGARWSAAMCAPTGDGPCKLRQYVDACTSSPR